MEYEFIDKTIFFPETGILAIGDLHIGYEKEIIKSGVLVPEIQVKEILRDLEKIINRIKFEGKKIKKIIFLGDIKTFFNYEPSERFNFNKVLEFLKKYVPEKDIILIKGNHDKFDFSGKPMKNYYFRKGIMFLHGHMEFPKVFEERVKMIVMGHLHPTVIISDKQNIKKEKYRCFLVGKYKGKEIIVIPSFSNIVRGSSLNQPLYELARKVRGMRKFSNPDVPKDFSIIPHQFLKNFVVHAINDNGEIFDFGKLKNL